MHLILLVPQITIQFSMNDVSHVIDIEYDNKPTIKTYMLTENINKQTQHNNNTH